MPQASALSDVAVLFLRLGLTAFGGPAAHVALMEEECVRRRGWLTPERFLDVLGASNLIPGPTSTELAMHVGYHRAGWAGLVVAGVCFILPASLVVGVIAAVYVEAGSLPALDGVLRAVKPVALVVVLQALVGLAQGAFTSWRAVAVAAVAALGVLGGVPEVVVLLSAGAVHLAGTAGATAGAAVLILAAPAGVAAAGVAVVSAASLFGYFVKAGSVIFGSGYVLFAVLRTDLVDGLRWLTEAQLLDAIAVGQVTPGPVFTSATFIGYLLGGSGGAVAATVGVFLPAFVCSAASVTLLHRLRESTAAKRFLQGVNVAAVALIAVAAVALSRAAVVDLPTVAIALGAAVALAFRLNSSWLLAAAAALGLLSSLM